MYRIIEKERLSDEIVKIEVEAPLVASKAVSGQFVMIRLREGGERIPLTISGCDPERGTITIVFQEVGKTTLDLGRLEPGDSILNLAGPLGRPPELKRFGTVVCVGGGVGIAPVLFRARVLKELGNRIISIIGARSRDMLILKEEMEEVSDRLYVTTDDGSLGRKGFVTDPLRDVLSDEQVDLVVAIGPIGMMKAVSGVAAEFGVRTAVSLNPIMLDGTGMCGSCRVIVGGEVRFACVDGPEFDGGLVDFDALLLRNRRYLEEEEISLKRARGCESHEKAGSSKAYQELR
ncbi:MAG TPA: sulfide/dihydroorotate dehydrogenase-like FAD/NAD-binding protein [Candidatus Syntrophoarchaeum butanivorans]|uniref:Sulfide/dihydroorotate dehydrogenase-like FAD/NAD-binding protein n=1 Tax=Candidatus Syntropharchaeum butanivorans TaxID=1839936 RepID=A0A7C1B742_9EURY|nr:sulfide/dihydroorotate dehydrogenase-like FAD/NAD-binding protein [Candidatus Syntrophoarchaeum butanivorans]